MNVGLPELVVLVFMVACWCLPIVAAIWLLRTVAKVNKTQDQILERLTAIERKIGA